MHVVIIGNGIAGVSAALRLRELDPECRITMISGESTHHYSRPALMYVFMGHMTYKDIKPFEDHVWAEQRIELLRDWVVGIDHAQRTLSLHKGQPLQYDELIIATGSKSNKFGWPGQDLQGVQGLYDLFDLRMLHDNVRDCERAVIVGGGLIGIELAEMLLVRGVNVTFLVREKSYWNRILPNEESDMINRLIRSHHVDLQLETELESIHEGKSGRVGHIMTKSGERIDCQIVGLTAGVSPNVDVAKASGVPCGRGVLVNKQLQAQVPHVWSIGDCAEIVTGDERNTLQQVWYTGRFQGQHAAECILGATKDYDSGIWFNSAKFFDVEYQTYGQVNLHVEGEQNLYWEHPTENVAVRIVHKDGRVIGFNFMGTRYRHEQCETWIRDGATVDAVLADFGRAAFDPEFFTPYHEMAVAAFGATVSAEAAR